TDANAEPVPEPVANPAPEPVAAVPADDEFSREVSQVRARLEALEQTVSFEDALPWMADDPTISVLQGHAKSLEHALSDSTETGGDQVAEQINDVRRRLEALKNSLGSGPN